VLALRVPTVRQRFLLDTNVYDQLIGSGARLAHLIDLCNQGHLELLMTDVQHDQLEEARQRRHNMALAFVIPFTFTPTYGVVPGVSRANQARYGNRDLLRRLGADVDVPAPWPPPPEWDESRLLSLRKNGDALLAATAIYERAVFVTDDKQLTNRARAERAEVWSAADFIRHIDGLSLTAASGGVPGGAGPLDLRRGLLAGGDGAPTGRPQRRRRPPLPRSPIG
jgi:rRNA-processing protein FCF1